MCAISSDCCLLLFALLADNFGGTVMPSGGSVIRPALWALEIVGLAGALSVARILVGHHQPVAR